MVGYCESKIAAVSDAMTHVGYDVFCSSYWKKDVEFWLLTLEASDFYPQSNMLNGVYTGNNRPDVWTGLWCIRIEWQLYSVWGCSLCHPQRLHPAFFFFPFAMTESQLAASSLFWSEVWQVYSFIYFVGLCYWEFLVVSQWGWLADSSTDLFP